MSESSDDGATVNPTSKRRKAKASAYTRPDGAEMVMLEEHVAINRTVAKALGLISADKAEHPPATPEPS
jgi:hypothetical protein